MYSSQTPVPTHVRASKSPYKKLPAHRREGDDDNDTPQPSSSSEQQQQAVTKKPAIPLPHFSVEILPPISFPTPLSLPATALRKPMSTLQLQPEVKNSENGSAIMGEGLGLGLAGDEEEKKARESHKKRSKNWTRPETLHLIRLRTQLEPRFAKSGRKTELWDEIAESLRKGNILRDAQQCRDKWEKLTAGYKEVRDGVKDREDNPFYDELHPLMSGKSMKRERSETDRDENHHKEKDTIAKDITFPKDIITTVPKDTIAIRKDVLQDAALLEVPSSVPVAMEEEEELRHGDGDEIEVEDEDEVGKDALEPSRKKKPRGAKYISVTDVTAVQSVLETVISRQQKFFRELLDSMERKEQMREQLRQEKEDKWRAEERAQRGVFNNAMIVLTQKLVGEQIAASLAPMRTPPPPLSQLQPQPQPQPQLHTQPHTQSQAEAQVGSPEGLQGGPKRRSKNWKRTEVLQLIKLRGEMDARFAQMTRRVALWDELAELLLVQGIKRDGKQCREKWDKLVAEYKDVNDGKRDQRESPYYTELTAILGRPSEAG